MERMVVFSCIALQAVPRRTFVQPLEYECQTYSLIPHDVLHRTLRSPLNLFDLIGVAIVIKSSGLQKNDGCEVKEFLQPQKEKTFRIGLETTWTTPGNLSIPLFATQKKANG